MHRGFIKLYRLTLDTPIFQNEGLLKLWLWCLLKASHKKRWVPIKTGSGITTIEVNPGQFIYGRDSAAAAFGMKPSTVRNRIKKLEALGVLHVKKDTHYSIITIAI